MRIPPRDDVAALEGYHSPQLTVDVRLNTNESPYPPPEAWREALLEELAGAAYNRYPDRAAADLRRALADTLGVAPEQVLPTNGSNEALQLVLLAYGGSGRAAALFDPTYQLHGHIARITGTRVVVGSRSADFGLDLDEARRVIDEAQPAVTFLCSPNNPTGVVDDAAAVEQILAMVPGVLVVDEAYAQFSPWSALSMVGGGRPIAVVQTYSKIWSMAAFRLGYLVASAEMIETVERVLLPYHLSTPVQIAGRLALRYEAEMRARVDAIVAERNRVAAGLAQLPVTQWPSGANFILFRPDERDGHDVWNGLVERSVLVRDCTHWSGLTGCLRVSVGTPAENDAFLDALTKVLS